ncbi:hypothetical protein B0J17DRAFT_633189 [Rhizoctonia solani]|nr:hypothetical protein B0J17DRAFT_633189 [Rhizoctonia solani]
MSLNEPRIGITGLVTAVTLGLLGRQLHPILKEGAGQPNPAKSRSRLRISMRSQEIQQISKASRFPGQCLPSRSRRPEFPDQGFTPISVTGKFQAPICVHVGYILTQIRETDDITQADEKWTTSTKLKQIPGASKPQQKERKKSRTTPTLYKQDLSHGTSARVPIVIFLRSITITVFRLVHICFKMLLNGTDSYTKRKYCLLPTRVYNRMKKILPCHGGNLSPRGAATNITEALGYRVAKHVGSIHRDVQTRRKNTSLDSLIEGLTEFYDWRKAARAKPYAPRQRCVRLSHTVGTRHKKDNLSYEARPWRFRTSQVTRGRITARHKAPFYFVCSRLIGAPPEMGPDVHRELGIRAGRSVWAKTSSMVLDGFEG